ncbi:hypothetical protein NE634_17325, partial [Lacrimispora saccharolytica]|nr:hypothetical protein [Lacrimispora saccharolytica]
STNTYSLTWDGTAKQGNYTVSEELGTLAVTETADEIVVTTTGGEFTYDGTAHGAAVEVTGLPKGYRVETAASSATATDVTETEVAATCDTLVIKNASGKDVTASLKITKVDGMIKITPAPLTVVTPNASKAYDGTALTAEGSISGFVNGETATFETTGSQTNEGKSKNTYSLTWDGSAKESNYTVSATVGELEVTKGEIKDYVTLTPQDVVKTYDGEAHKAGTATAEDTNGNELKIEYQKADGSWTTNPADIT